MNTHSLKFRLVAWYAGWLTVIFIVFGVFVYASLSYYLERSLRDALARRARLVAEIAQQATGDWEHLGAQIQRHFAPEANSRFTRISRNGTVLYASGAPADQSFNSKQVPLPDLKVPGEMAGRRTLPDGTVLLVVVVGRGSPENLTVAEEGQSVAAMDSTLHAWLLVLVAGLALLVFGAVLGGAWLVQRALKPVDHITRSAEHISSRNLSERLPVPPTGDEIERLSLSINGMIRRLDEGFQQTQRFFADASHELRTPLTIIQGELEAVAKDTNATPAIRATATSTLEEVERLKNIVQGLFALSRLDAGEAQANLELVDLSELAATTTDQMCLLAEDKKISITCRTRESVKLTAERARLKQVLVNLLDNAIKYTPDGGHVEVSVARRNGHAVIEVSDNGIGIPEEALPRVFERFFRVDKARSRSLGGAGLGLSIVRSICQAHNGRIDVQSKEGQGTRFTVELPMERE